MGSLALGNYANGLYGIFTSQSIFLRSNKVLEWQPGAPKSPGARFSKKKKRPTFENHRTSDAPMCSVAL